ncbi:HRDC domain-containing protein [Butyrivibrio sp. JL13D10]|uniref:HRDC domain-containing protein n=1 Tax=Butyrivibrio sp. JL13D10 TaxID=3236815 RepID=UPI0038B5C75E
MRKDEYALTKELRRLEKYGLLLQAKRVGFLEDEGYKYNILFTKDKSVLEPECGVAEVMGIINALDTCLELYSTGKLDLIKENLKKNDTQISDIDEDNSQNAYEIVDESKSDSTASKEELTASEKELFEVLRGIRYDYAKSDRVAPFIVFQDRSLIDMCKKHPCTKAEMLNVRGVSEKKYDKYGNKFLEAIQQYNDNNQTFGLSDQPTNTAHVELNERDKKSKERGDFYLNAGDGEKFIYREFYNLGEIAEELNRVCTANVKKVTTAEISDILVSEGIILIDDSNGVHNKLCTEYGKNLGISEIRKITQAGVLYVWLKYPLAVQKIVVEKFTRGSVVKPEISVTYEYEDVIYHFENGKWLDDRNITAPVYITKKLNQLYPDATKVTISDDEELKKLYQRAVAGDNYSLAISACEKGLRKGSESARYFLPMISAAYRKMNMAQKALDISDEYYGLYGERVISAALLTSNGAAYADLGMYDLAMKMANRAYAMSGGKGSPELSALYARINKEM